MTETGWKYYTPQFESDAFNLEMMKYSPWSDHRAFGYDYVRNQKPKKIVELGSYYGCSAFAFLQAIKDGQMNSSFTAIDTWQGDSFTENDYTENIYQAYKEIQDGCFNGQNPRMLRMTFDEARKQFADESIDLLHIDGSHTYEDVKHDFLTWRSTVKKDGAIFFHDVGEDDLYGQKMGSHIFWEELKKEYPFTLEFPFSFGLGILFFDERCCKEFKEKVNLEIYQEKANMAASVYKDSLRKDFFKLRDQSSYIESLTKQVKTEQDHLKKYEHTTAEKDQYIAELEKQQEDLTEKCRTVFQEMKDNDAQYEASLQAYKESTKAKDAYISELETERTELTEKCRGLFEDVQRINLEYQKNIEGYKTILEGKEDFIEELQDTIERYKENVQGKDAFAAELQETIQKYGVTVREKENYIQELNSNIDALKETVDRYQETVAGKDSYAMELKETIDRYQKNVDGKDHYISELRETIEKYRDNIQETVQKYQETVNGKDAYIDELEQRLKNTEEAYHKEKQDMQREIENLTDGNKALEEVISRIPLGKYVRKRMERKRGQ